ncbi:MAG TPA: diaminopimelate decarboxylase [Clostridiales bacterium UBA8153]|nr:diaminopimelate decarboxylase [Clostridiales bacterium UBA8153]
MEMGMAPGSGHLVWGGCDCVELAACYGTPLYVMDQDEILARMRRYLHAGRVAYGDLSVAYAGKAFLCGALVQLVAREGLWLDVVSGGELQLALSAGMPAERIIFHGNNKSHEELQLGLVADVGRFVVDNHVEMEGLSRLAATSGRTARVLVRISPGVRPSTHRAIQTGQVDSKFGFPVAGGMALAAVKRACQLPGLQLLGLHSHIGSQIRDLAPFRAASRATAKLAWDIWEATGYLVREINLGGGWAANYAPGPEDVAPLEVYLAAMVSAFKAAWRRHGRSGVPLGYGAAAGGAGGKRFAWPRLFIEPGRSIVAESGITLYTVGAVKPAAGHHAYVVVDGGMTDNPRPALYGARHHAILANRNTEPPTGTYTLAGKACESGDVLIHNLALPAPRPGDLIAVFATGAYNHSMSSNYNLLARPAVAFASRGNSQLVVRRQTYEDMLCCDLFTGAGKDATELPAPPRAVPSTTKATMHSQAPKESVPQSPNPVEGGRLDPGGN